ncbi:unnamed protein product [Adineta steineri]|uniref:Uncharacterized protein n=1 Tax=Adineta steineri TaxID=433720 RepID=A0A813QLS4_9BILA|nr:unnamed protein product [Adineta steineri]CAF3649241.1 unnamed protein product [Adineta steineri]
MVKLRNLLQLIPRRYYYYLYFICFLCSLIFLVYHYDHIEKLEVEKSIIDSSNDFDLYDDDDMLFNCPSEIQFNIKNRQHLAIIIAPKLVPFLWKNFRALLCTGVDVYIMFNEVFNISSSSRGDDFPACIKRSTRSYTHRFLFVTNEKLEKYGVSYMTKYPTIKYTSLDRAIVWLYHRKSLTTVWLMNYGVQWYHINNITYLFDIYTSYTTDILCEGIVETNSARWKQWPQNQSDIFPKSYWIGTFNPLVRYSRRLLFHHYKYMQLIHKNRLHYEIDTNFRFHEFIMGTIANIEQLSIAVFNQKIDFLHLSLGDYNTTFILFLLRQGKHIIHPITYDSILTKYSFNYLVKLINNNN